MFNRRRSLRAVATIAVAAACAVPWPAAALDTIPFTQTGEGAIEVQGSVDGQAPVSMLVNLGAGIDLLSSGVGRRLVLVGGKYVSLRLTGQRVDLPIGTVQTLAIGGVQIEAPHVGIWNGLDGSGIDGVIAATAFRNIATTFDFLNHQIVIEDAPSFAERVRSAGRVPVVLQDDLGIALGIFARFDFGDGKSGLCEIDTGSQGITLDRTFATAQGLDPGGTPNPQIGSIALVGAPQTALANPPVSIGNLVYDCDVGNAFWAGRSFTLDVPNRWLYVAKPA